MHTYFCSFESFSLFHFLHQIFLAPTEGKLRCNTFICPKNFSVDSRSFLKFTLTLANVSELLTTVFDFKVNVEYEDAVLTLDYESFLDCD